MPTRSTAPRGSKSDVSVNLNIAFSLVDYAASGRLRGNEPDCASVSVQQVEGLEIVGLAAVAGGHGGEHVVTPLGLSGL